jgi:PPOX class probable F420-dependent enzyme
VVEIPEAFHELLASRAVAFVSTIGKRGEPQVNPIWFLWDGERVRISLVEGRQKLRNLRRDPRIALAVVDPARPGRRTTSNSAEP